MFMNFGRHISNSLNNIFHLQFLKKISYKMCSSIENSHVKIVFGTTNFKMRKEWGLFQSHVAVYLKTVHKTSCRKIIKIGSVQ